MSPAPTLERGHYLRSYDRLFEPASIAVVGASDNPSSAGGTVYANLRKDFPGRLFAVNARRQTVQGDPAVPSLDDVDKPVDLVIVITPATEVPGQLQKSADRGDGAAVIISSGFAEAGAAGKSAQDEVSRIASESGMPVLGPNCIGFMNGHQSVMANFSIRAENPRPRPGPVALVSQSGGFGSYILEKAVTAGVRVGMFVSTGNEADINVSRMLRYFVERPDVTTLLTYCEALRDPDVFLQAAQRAAELDKVIVALKTGNSEATARAALSHTASIVGASEVFDAVSDQYGVLRGRSIEELIDAGLLFQTGKRMHGRRLGVITSSGGCGVLIADSASRVAMELPALPPEDQAVVASQIPTFGSAQNPVDLTAQHSAFPPESYGIILDTVAGSSAIDAVICVPWTDEGVQADGIRRVEGGQDKPIVAVVTIGGAKFLNDGIPAFGDPTRAVRALAALATLSARSRPDEGARRVTLDKNRAAQARSLLAAQVGQPFVLESVAKQVLALYGVPVPREIVVNDADAAAAAAEVIGGAVALKALSHALAHKSDHGGLRLGVRGGASAARTYTSLVAELRSRGIELDGVLVQEMVPAHIELMCGLSRDPLFGPVVGVSLGGALVEVLGNPVLLRAPFTRAEAEYAVRSIAGGRVMHPVRGLDSEGASTLAAAMAGVATLAIELPEVVTIDINPLRVSSGRVCAVDALIVVSGGPDRVE